MNQYEKFNLRGYKYIKYTVKKIIIIIILTSVNTLLDIIGNFVS